MCVFVCVIWQTDLMETQEYVKLGRVTALSENFIKEEGYVFINEKLRVGIA